MSLILFCYTSSTNLEAIISKHTILIIIASILLVAAIAGSLVVTNNNKQQNTQTTTTPTESANNSADTQDTAEIQSPTTEVSGTFTSVGVKTGSGSVSLVTENNIPRITLGKDFTVEEGPDLFIGFGNNDTIDTAALVAPLTSTTGAQTYEVPATIDTAKYNQIFIYCKEYATVFSIATLN